ncbi:MAG: CHAP domain-containing protein [bacterium]|jgi:hypothetical protein
MTLAEKAVEIAIGYIGVKESPPGSNRGPQVDRFLAATGLSGAPWCAAFVFAVYQEAAKALQAPNPFADIKEPARAFAYREWGRRHNCVVKEKGDQKNHHYAPGMLVVFDFSHIGIVEKDLGDGTVQTIEGNTDAKGSRTGGQVMRKIRQLKSGDVVVGVRETAPISLPPKESYIRFLNVGWTGVLRDIPIDKRSGHPDIIAANAITRHVKDAFNLD